METSRSGTRSESRELGGGVAALAADDEEGALVAAGAPQNELEENDDEGFLILQVSETAGVEDAEVGD